MKGKTARQNEVNGKCIKYGGAIIVVELLYVKHLEILSSSTLSTPIKIYVLLIKKILRTREVK